MSFQDLEGYAISTDNINEDIAGDVVYRFFNKNTGVHFYTASEAERDVVQESDNFSFEGGSYVGVDSLTGEAEPVPVYRFLNQNTGVHLYTISERERDVVQELDNFSFEGEAFSAYESEVEGSIPIYRFFNNTSGAHFYTPSAGERDNVEDNLLCYSTSKVVIGKIFRVLAAIKTSILSLSITNIVGEIAYYPPGKSNSRFFYF